VSPDARSLAILRRAIAHEIDCGFDPEDEAAAREASAYLERLIAASAACRGAIDLFEAWRDGIFKRMGITWQTEPPAIIELRRVSEGEKC
jgi:hypothetical protein